MKLENFWKLTIVFFAIALIMVTGCDEGMNVVKPVITNPGDNPGDPTTNGEIKRPDDTNPGEQPNPVEPKPTLAINTVAQADNGSVTISGTSTDMSAGTGVTVVLGDNAITVKTSIDKDGTWSVIVPAQKTAQLSPGTTAVTATAEQVMDESSFKITPPTPEPIEPHENDFVGRVVIPRGNQEWPISRAKTRIVSSVTLTVVSGERAGEQSVTDKQGNYRFSDPTGETLQLRLRAEKKGYEPKEVIVHRDEPTETLDDGIPGVIVSPRTQKRPTGNPGNDTHRAQMA